MQSTKGSMVFYGLDSMNSKLDAIMQILNLENQNFEIKLIISEALTNAFFHGNKSDINKPIQIEWEIAEKKLIITVTDSGTGIKEFGEYKKNNKENILEESGRGLFIISSYTDEVVVNGNSIIMKKSIL